MMSGSSKRRHAVDCVIDFRFVERRDLAGHGVERTRFFTHRDHLDDHVGEQAGVFHRALQALTGGHFVAHFHHRVFEHDVAAGAGHRLERFHQWHAGGEHGRQRTRESRHRGLVDDGADDWKLEREPIQPFAHGLRALLEIDEGVNRTGQDHRHEHAVVLQAARAVDDELREGRQLRTEALEQALELRDHEHQQDDGDDHGDDHDRRRVEEGFLDLLLEGFGLFLVGRDLVEQGFESTGLFAGLDEVHEQVVEVERMLAERLVQRGAAFHVRLDVEDQLLHRRLVVAVADDLERLDQRNTGGQHGGELAAEHRDVFGP